jgi:hypothetical protein
MAANGGTDYPPGRRPGYAVGGASAKEGAMRRRWFVLGAGALALLGATGIFFYCWTNSPAPGVTEENFKWLCRGMTESQADAILGDDGKRHKLTPPRDLAAFCKTWHSKRNEDGSRTVVEVYLDRQGTVISAIMYSGCEDYPDITVIDAETSFWDRLRRLLPW